MNSIKSKLADIIITTGYVCNNNCLFCYEKSHIFNKTTHQIKKELRTAIKRDIYSVHFDGGEPTIRPDIIEIINYAKKIGFKRITLVSNGRMFAYKDFCEKIINSGLTNLLISVLGDNPKIHDYLTQTPGSFSQLAAGLSNLKNFKNNINIGGNIVVNNINYTCLDKIVKFLKSFDIKWVNFICICPIGQAFENKELIPRYKEAVPYLKQAIRSNASVKISIQNIPFCLMDKYLKNIVDEADWKNKSLIKLPNEKMINLGVKLNRIKSTLSTCRDCIYLSKCGGVWNNYLGIFGLSEFINNPCNAVDHSYAYSKMKSYDLPGYEKISHNPIGGCVKIYIGSFLKANAESLFYLEGGKLFYYQTNNKIPDKALKFIRNFGQIFVNKGNNWPTDLYPVRLNIKCCTCRYFLCTKCSGYYISCPKNVLENSEYEKLLVNEIRKTKGRLLDVGCGQGNHTNIIKELYLENKLVYHGIDPDKSKLNLLRSKLNNIKNDLIELKIGTAEKLSYRKNYFDTVLLIRSYSHILDLDSALGNIKKVLKKNGTLIIMDNAYFAIINPILSIDKKNHWSNHYRVHNSLDAVKELKRHGFSVVLHKPVKPAEGCWFIKCKI